MSQTPEELKDLRTRPSRDLVSDELMQYFQTIVFVILGGSISLFGIANNIINIIVFIKQGFKESINISLFGLTLADFACVLTMLGISIFNNPLVMNAGLPFNSFDVPYMTVGWIHVCFNRITSLITAFITLERCLCIAMPLKVKTLMTPLKTKLVIASIFTAMFILFSPFYYVNKLEWVFNPLTNKTLLTLIESKDRVLVDTITFPIHSFGISIMALLSVAICTVVLVVKLNKKSQWRLETMATSSMKRRREYLKDKKVVKMVVTISTIYVVCYSPATVIFLVMAYDPRFSFTGVFQNLLYIVWSINSVLEVVNSSVNIFVYINMSTKFRKIFIGVFIACARVTFITLDK